MEDGNKQGVETDGAAGSKKDNSRPMRSASIKELAPAISKAQMSIGTAHKDKENPFFHSSYADLASVWDACRESLTSNGLSVLQPTFMEQGRTFLETILLHSSGEWMSGVLEVKPVKDDPQGMGSALTYARRYGLSALIGVCPSDDDGEEGMNRNKGGSGNAKTKPAPPRSKLNPPKNQPAPPESKSDGETKAKPAQINEIKKRLSSAYEGVPDTVKHTEAAKLLAVEKVGSFEEFLTGMTFKQASYLIGMLGEGVKNGQ